MKKDKQVELVLAYIKTHGSITQQQSTDDLGITRLSARIWDLNHAGIRIDETREQGVNRRGEATHYSRYTLSKQEEEKVMKEAKPEEKVNVYVVGDLVRGQKIVLTDGRTVTYLRPLRGKEDGCIEVVNTKGMLEMIFWGNIQQAIAVQTPVKARRKAEKVQPADFPGIDYSKLGAQVI